MQYQSYDIGQLSGGEIVEVTLKGNSANVKLMDSSNFSSYKSGRRHTYYGGHVTNSPYKIPVPRSGRWYVTVDLGGYPRSAECCVKACAQDHSAFLGLHSLVGITLYIFCTINVI